MANSVQVEEDVYLEEYFGMARDILLKEDVVTITFYAIMDDDLSFTFKRKYASKAEALMSLGKYIENTRALKAGLAYNTESIKRINDSIGAFVTDVLKDAVDLPDQYYKFLGDKDYLKPMLERYVNYEDQSPI